VSVPAGCVLSVRELADRTPAMEMLQDLSPAVEAGMRVWVRMQVHDGDV